MKNRSPCTSAMFTICSYLNSPRALFLPACSSAGYFSPRKAAASPAPGVVADSRVLAEDAEGAVFEGNVEMRSAKREGEQS